jgi:hypothetical protein
MTTGSRCWAWRRRNLSTSPDDAIDWGHVVLGALLIVVAATKLRTSHRRRFGLTVVIKREGLDDVETQRSTDTRQQHESDEGDEIIPP